MTYSYVTNSPVHACGITTIAPRSYICTNLNLSLCHIVIRAYLYDIVYYMHAFQLDKQILVLKKELDHEDLGRTNPIKSTVLLSDLLYNLYLFLIGQYILLSLSITY